MDNFVAIAALSALAQETRLAAFRALIAAGAEGMAAGRLAEQLSVPQNTLSTHLAMLAQAGLVTGERRSRSIIYRAEIDRLRDLMLFLIEDCCGGHPELCLPLADALRPCCDSAGKAKAGEARA